MNFEFLPAVVAGVVGGAVMSVTMGLAKAAGLTKMDMSLIEGAFLTGDRAKAKAIGLVMHLVVMSGVVFGSIYALLFAAFDVSTGNAWWYGLVFGVVHGLVAGMAMPMLPMLHPRMEADPVPAGGPPGELRLTPPGAFAKNMGSITPVGMLMSHILFGLVVGLVYAALV